jgi:hypothetical protein
MGARTRIVAGVPSRSLPPWLDTEIAVAPASAARFASSMRVMPLTMNGPPHCPASQRTSSQAGSGEAAHCRYAPKNVGAGSPRPVMFGTVRSGTLPVFA